MTGVGSVITNRLLVSKSLLSILAPIPVCSALECPGSRWSVFLRCELQVGNPMLRLSHFECGWFASCVGGLHAAESLSFWSAGSNGWGSSLASGLTLGKSLH